MTDESNNHSRPFTENEMDQLLSTFYKMEIPQALNSLPSTWPELHNAQAGKQKSVALTVTPAAESGRPVPTVSRGIAVAVATLAACMMLMVFSQVESTPEPSGTAATTVTPVEPDEQLMNVSSGEPNGALDENQTSLQEIDQIDLSPVESPAKNTPATE